MTSDTRMSEPLTGTGSAPAVDIVAAPPDVEPDDTLAALLGSFTVAPTGDNATLTEQQRATLYELAAVKALRNDYQDRDKALGQRATELQKALLELLDDPDADLDPDKPFEAFEENGTHRVAPYLQRPWYPKYRDADDSGTQYTMADLVAAVRETGDPEVTALINVSMAREWSSWAGRRVKRWAAMRGGNDEGRIVDGRYVDLDGVLLTEDELGDPAAEALALPQQVRRIVDMVQVTDIRFRRSPLKSKAVAAVDAQQQAAQAAHDAQQADPSGDQG